VKRSLFARGLAPAVLLSLGAARAADVDAPREELPPPPPPAARPMPLVDWAEASARVTPEPPAPGRVTLQVHGELALRAALASESRLRRADGSFGELGLAERYYYWLRVTPRVRFGADFEIVGQADVPRGSFDPSEPSDVEISDEPYAGDRILDVDPRWLYAEYRTRSARLRIGQQPFHHGMGVVENDGDHPPLFGDYYGGDRYERAELVISPAQTPWQFLVAFDLVYRDDAARLTDGDVALRGSLGMYYGDERARVSALGIFRHQRSDDAHSATREFSTMTLDSAGHYRALLRRANAEVFAEYEIAYRFGDESASRALGGIFDDDAGVSAFGAAIRLGAAFAGTSGGKRFGRWVPAVEWGYASGDASPGRGKNREFSFDPNHRVGLLVFDEVLRWKTARSAALLGAPPPGPATIASQGAVRGATYVNPTLIFRPRNELDLKAGLVLAQATEDVVDPSSSATGAKSNYDGGSSSARDLGVELDAGIEWRVSASPGLNLELGAQGGVFFPGRAFDTASGDRLDTQYIAVGRLGVQF
jgi:hypothetical protein